LRRCSSYQAIEPGHIGGVLASSPTDDGPATGSTWRASSIVRVESPLSASSRAATSQLSYKDFWPACLNAAEINLYQLEFETFEYVSYRIFTLNPISVTRGHAFILYKLQCQSFLRGINVWNSLPKNVDFSSLSKFKKLVSQTDFSLHLKNIP